MVSGTLDWLPGWAQSVAVQHPLRVIGIDLGTTNSTVTEIVWDPTTDAPPIVSILDIPQRTEHGEIVRDLVPSVVAVVDGIEYVGEGAHRLRASVRRHLRRGSQIWWETKNEIGTRRQYLGAPASYRTPGDIAARILSFLYEAALDASAQPIDKVVITVPASFQLTQRQDTLAAAEAAGIELSGQDLFDEPVAAFLDYLVHSKNELLEEDGRSRVMVVDFGGGTCDVALLEATKEEGGGLAVARKGVSRFHRIGGSDIDAVIAHDVLLPQLMEENGIGPFELNYKHKRDFVLPALTSLAEQLKKKVSDEALRRRQLGRFDPDDPSIRVTLPVPFEVDTGRADRGVVTLAQPTLTLQQWRAASKRFLNATLLAPAIEEYYQAASIFAPIGDVLSRADWSTQDVEKILLVGGASLDYAVPEVLSSRFDCEILTYRDPFDAQRCVGRGAAYQALLLAALEDSPLRATIGDAVLISTTSGSRVVIPANASLPFPPDGSWRTVAGLTMSAGAAAGDHVDLQVEFLSGERPLHTQICPVAGPVEKGEPIGLRLRVDDNQRLEIHLEVRGADEAQEFEVELDNPFSVTANPNADRDRIQELEEIVAQEQGANQRKAVRELADLHHRLKEYERARHLLEGLLRTASPQEGVTLASRLASLCDAMHDQAAKLDYLREAIRLGDRAVAPFNLALALRADGPGEALKVMDAYLAHRDDGPARSLRASILERLGRGADARQEYQRAVEQRKDVADLSAFELAWLRPAGVYLGDRALVERVDKARNDLDRRERASGEAVDRGDGALLPDWRG